MPIWPWSILNRPYCMTKEANDVYAAGRCQNRMVRAAYDMEDMEKARSLSFEAERIMKEHGCANEQGMRYKELSRIQVFEGKDDAAMTSAQWSFKYAQQTSAPGYIIGALAQVANVFRVQKQFEQARDALSQCGPLIDQYDDFAAKREYYLSRIALYHATKQTELKQINEDKLQTVIDNAIKGQKKIGDASKQERYAKLLTGQRDRYLGWMLDNRR